MICRVVAALLVVSVAMASAILVGAPQNADINSQDVQDALKFAVQQYNKVNQDEYLSRVLKVIKAQEQVVSGMKYIFTVEMVRTSCKKGETEDSCASNLDPAKAQT
ncbi:cystatin-like [Trichomycterus rosablanca]|uniref:cystatin-like n=1 Tax=Trichomycterus rosablanca TaxID=2290929 RepID=UPI002F35AA23